VRPAVRLGGVAGALLSVKKQEDSDDEGRRRRAKPSLAPKIAIRPQLRSAASAAARAREESPAHEFGYGEAESDEESEEAITNGHQPKKSSLVAVAAKVGRGRQDARAQGGRGLFGAMQGHLASAKRQLTDERGGIKVKEEARWEPDNSPARPDAKAGSGDESAEEASAPRKRAKIEQKSPKEHTRRDKVQEAEDEAKREAKEMHALQRRLESHYSSMKNFIRTKAEPTIFYLPAKHNTQSQRQLEETRSAISQKIASLKVHLQTAPASADEEAASE